MNGYRVHKSQEEGYILTEFPLQRFLAVPLKKLTFNWSKSQAKKSAKKNNVTETLDVRISVSLGREILFSLSK